MRCSWRFYADPDREWHWQQLGLDGTLLAESPRSYPDYEACVRAAHERGYVFAEAQAGLPRSSSTIRRHM